MVKRKFRVRFEREIGTIMTQKADFEIEAETEHQAIVFALASDHDNLEWEDVESQGNGEPKITDLTAEEIKPDEEEPTHQAEGTDGIEMGGSADYSYTTNPPKPDPEIVTGEDR